MTTCTFQLVGVPKGSEHISKFRYNGPPKDVEILEIPFPWFAGGLEEIEAFSRWAKENKLKVEEPDHVTYVVACKQKHLFAFWQQCYAPVLMQAAKYLASGDKVSRRADEDTIQRVMALRKALEGLNSRKLYALIAYEY